MVIMIKEYVNHFNRNTLCGMNKDPACKKEETKGNNMIKQYKNDLL